MSSINRGFFLSAVMSAILVIAAVFTWVPASWDEIESIGGIDAVSSGETISPRLFVIFAVIIGIVSAPDERVAWIAISLAAAHHRLAWIHPFGDGNGRVARLQTQAAMICCGVDGEGLWTLSRGLARQRQTYFSKLAGADASRGSDLDGRGNLSDRGLSEFCLFLLHTILDQMTFMVGLVEPFTLAERIERYLGFVRTDLDETLRGRLSRLLRGLVWEGEVPRGKVPELLGVKGTTARDVIRQAVQEGLVTSDSEKRPLRIAFPDKVVEYYFPGLFTDLPVD
jgi:hypothetical protein